MAGNLTIWGGEQPRGEGSAQVGRAAKGSRQGDVEWQAVTTMADGSEERKASDPEKAVGGEEYAHQMFIKKWLRNDPDATVWRKVIDAKRAEALERERQVGKELARGIDRETRNQEDMTVRRLMRVTVMRLAAMVNGVVVGQAGVERMVTTRELRAAFVEFLVDARKDKVLKKPREYRQWLWADRNTVYLAPAGRRKNGGQGRVAG